MLMQRARGSRPMLVLILLYGVVLACALQKFLVLASEWNPKQTPASMPTMERASPEVSQQEVPGREISESQEVKPIETCVPERYVIGCGGDRTEAARRWANTVKWRADNNIDGILEEPQPHFDGCKRVFPTYLYGRGKGGHPVLWERIGKVDVPHLDEMQVPPAVLPRHYVFLFECIFRVVLDPEEDANNDAQFITVEDVQGISLRHLTPRVLGVVRSLTGVVKDHYVERCHKSYIINAPALFTLVWRIISPLLDPRTKAKIVILGTDHSKMREEIPLSEMPAEYGGTCTRAMDDSDAERRIRAVVDRANATNPPGHVSGPPTC